MEAIDVVGTEATGAAETEATDTTVVTMGIDLGQRSDFTAIVVDEQDWNEDRHRIRHIERPPLGTPYPKIIERVSEIRDRIEKQTGYVPTILADATGVGRPVIDEFQAKGVDVWAVTILAGDSVTEEGRELHVGKLALVSRLDVLLSDSRIEWDGRTPLGKKLTEELHRFQLKISQSGILQFEAEKRFHDDLVTALALAVFTPPKAVGGAFLDLWPTAEESMWKPWPG